jgi:hypothetical protein
MSDFEQVLEKCLNELASGASGLDECLARHPEYAAQLQPLLLTAARVEMASELRPSAAFKARARAKLTLHMQAHPRKRAASGFTPWLRLASALVILVLAFLVTGTVYAQGVLPGDLFYDWKLVSERLWRRVSPNPVNTDLAIANRRIGEINVVSNDPVRRARALKGYQEVVTRLEAEVDAKILESILPPVDSFDFPEQVLPTPMPTLEDSTATPYPEGPEIIPTITPGILSTKLPNIVPTNAPGILSTKLPKLIPTIEIPPPIR